jgi:hypothetical protein
MKVQDQNSVTADEIVNEVLGDTYDETGIYKEKYYRWLFRIWTDLNFDFIRTKREMIIPVPQSTKIIHLPPDYQDLIFFGYIDNCRNLQPIHMNRNLAPSLDAIEIIASKCDKCGEVDLCKMIGQQQVTEEMLASSFIEFNGAPTVVDNNGKVIAQEDIYRKIYTREVWPDGSFVETVNEPVGTYNSNGTFALVDILTTKKTTCKLTRTCDTCVAATPGNLSMLKDCCCCDATMLCCTNDQLPYPVNPDVGHYNLFENDGYIMLSPNTCLTKVYIKYVSTGVCKNGKMIFPLVSMNSLIEGTYHLSIAKKKNVPQVEKERARRSYVGEKKLLLRRFTRLSYQTWREIVDQVPRIPTI